MSDLRVIGAGLGRTGTHSLKLALERLLGAPCYHMAEVFTRPQDIPVWHAAAKGERVDWRALFADYVAAVDWPPAAFWPQIAEAFPDAVILLSVRDADGWWKSASKTIFEMYRRGPKPEDKPGWRPMLTDMFGNTFTPSFLEEAPAKAAFVGAAVRGARRPGARRAVPGLEHVGTVPLPRRPRRVTSGAHASVLRRAFR